MPRVGSYTVGDGSLVGPGPLTPGQQDRFDVLAGASSATPGRHVPMRARYASIWAFDPEAWLPTAKLPQVELVGAVHAGSLAEPGIGQESLDFTVMDVGGYYSVFNHHLIDNGAWLCVRWSVAVAGTSLQQLGGVFRVTTDPSRSSEGAIIRYTVRAVDHLQYAATRLDYDGAVGSDIFMRWLNAWIESPGPYFTDGFSFIPDDDAAIGNILAGALFERIGALELGRIRVQPWPTLSTSVMIEPALHVGEVGKPATFYDVLRKLWLLVGGFWLTMAPDGVLELERGGNAASDSGAYVTVESEPLGAEPLPVDRPVQRAESQPEYDRVTYDVRRDPNPNPVESAGATVQEGPAAVTANSWSNIHPNFSSLRGVEEVVDRIPWMGADANHTFQAMGFPTWTDWAEYRLRSHLWAGDTASLSVDSAYPPPLGRLVRLHYPQVLDGRYQVVGFSRPLSAQPASWQLRWWGDA